jgi:hypothetical protein
MRARSRLTADEWAERLDELMKRVLARPSDFHQSIVVWATWRKRWLASREAHPEGGLDFYRFEPETAARAKFLRAAADLMPPEHCEEVECD